jgi:hypothetical protein
MTLTLLPVFHGDLTACPQVPKLLEFLLGKNLYLMAIEAVDFLAFSR